MQIWFMYSGNARIQLSKTAKMKNVQDINSWDEKSDVREEGKKAAIMSITELNGKYSLCRGESKKHPVFFYSAAFEAESNRKSLVA